jgi:hypothetical protein
MGPELARPAVRLRWAPADRSSIGPFLGVPLWERRLGRGTPAAEAPSGPSAAACRACAATEAGRHSPSARIPRSASGVREPRWARGTLPRSPPGRPPSRLDRRPRAGGMRGSARALPGRAAPVLVSELNRTCVRKISGLADGTGRTYVRPSMDHPRMAPLSQITAFDLQRKLQHGASETVSAPAGAGAANRALLAKAPPGRTAARGSDPMRRRHWSSRSPRVGRELRPI